jgi:hypothetical protein
MRFLKLSEISPKIFHSLDLEPWQILSLLRASPWRVASRKIALNNGLLLPITPESLAD